MIIRLCFVYLQISQNTAKRISNFKEDYDDGNLQETCSAEFNIPAKGPFTMEELNKGYIKALLDESGNIFPVAATLNR